ncbi:hypothetical protein [Jatrophihabitans endophyticus]|uniref:hypothetical protein n=1 Tax=Jatrophihabitans endophyticus TaxID=1206085 RepID=UPI0019FA81FB|nr:hypothetical protein [Jatrophihabitans endophyticus]MBE7189215.1 hypothetical protein [Jatrophihabitans endophyticus]
MGLKQWRQRRSMKDPVRGEFRPTGSYEAHPHMDSDFRDIMTGVVTGPGITPTAGEAIQDKRGRWVGHTTLPALVDRADPTDFQILWDEVVPFDDRAAAREDARRAAQAAAGAPTGAPAGAPAGEVPAPDGSAPAPAPEWARGLVADLASRGMIPGLDAESVGGVTIDAPQVTIEVGDRTGPAGGQAGTAVLRDVTDLDLPAESLPYPGGSLCSLTLDVNSPTGPYPVRTTLGFRSSRSRAAIAVPGTVLPVRIDPSDPQRVSVDVAKFYEQNPQLAP